MVRCLFQIFRPSISAHPPGWGDCRSCRGGSHNHDCRGYQPVEIELRIVRVKEAEEKCEILLDSDRG